MAKKTPAAARRTKPTAKPSAVPTAAIDVQTGGNHAQIAVQAQPSLDFDDAELSAEAHGDSAPPLAAGRQGDEGRPFCSKHNCLMKATGSKEAVTHYGCPVPGCSEKEKRARPIIKIPAEPKACPDVRCRGQQHFLEVIPKKSNVAQLHMECPSCGFHLKSPRPAFAPHADAQRKRMPREDLAAR